MARSKQTRGSCRFCDRSLTRGGMARHLRACEKRQHEIARAGVERAADRGRSDSMLHLQVEDAFSGRYWLHLEMVGSAPLHVLDDYLRELWLECCGHMSQFSVGDPWRGKEVPGLARASTAFRAGTEITHVYDFGTSSYTKIKLVDSRRGRPLTGHPIALLARNHPPDISCAECEQPAAFLCLECLYEEDRDGELCERHAAAHPHDEYGEFLPIVNSPRTGMCGYEGPAEEPS